ncbi:MAG: penicillin-binding protein, partial [Clostridiales bacterium]|nr:penicillin-binding protein [Clostridiales bacterium]
MDYSRNSNINTRRQHTSPTKKLRNKIGVIVFRVIISIGLIAGFAVMGAGIGLYMGVIQKAPDINVNIQPEIFTSIIYDAKTGVEVDRLKGSENRIYVKYSQMPDDLKDAFVAIEDERFYTHDGIDPKGIVRAAVTMARTRGARTEGASTITQQLIKNNVMKLSSNSVISKLQEQYLAVNFEKELAKANNGDKKAAKDYILEVYINTINLGHGFYGVQTAARNYFNKDVSELTLSECAAIAGITQNPEKYRPDIRPEKNKERQTMVLDNMLRLEYISQSEYDTAIKDNIYERIVESQLELEET